jgi:pimeloyl-ACP methyl ester carboxylesterase
MTRVVSNGLELEVEEYGDPAHPAVLLIMGLASQLTRWPVDFVGALVKAGYRVIAFDNRDIGLSTKLDNAKTCSPLVVGLLDKIGLASVVTAYKLTDMAKDTAGLLSALKIPRAHIVGASMGGMIGQILCADYPERIASFTAIMSSTNNPALPKASPEIIREVFSGRKPSSTRDELIDASVLIWNLIGTRDSGRSAAELREQIAASVDRNQSPAGIRRQVAAIIATRDLREWTGRIVAPSLVIHGSADPLVPLPCGLDIAKEIKDSKTAIIDGMGHDLPPRLVPTLAAHVLDHLLDVEKRIASVQAA